MRLFVVFERCCRVARSVGSAFALGDLGQKVPALIAYRHLTLKTRTALDTHLAIDDDPLTPPNHGQTRRRNLDGEAATRVVPHHRSKSSAIAATATPGTRFEVTAAPRF